MAQRAGTVAPQPRRDAAVIPSKVTQVQECLHCADDPYYFITTYCRTLDADGKVDHIPDWPFVREMIAELCKGDDIHIEKSRQMMATWIVCAFFLWSVMFDRGFAGIMTSRKEKLVDDGGERSTHESLLGRVRYMYDRLPVYVRRRCVFAHLRLTCPTNDGVVIGESTNPDIGRGGTFKRALLDEWAKVPQSELAYSAIRSACPRGIIWLSTPNGPVNNFARIRKLRTPGIIYHRVHWSQHPIRAADLSIDPVTGQMTSTWYREHTATMTPTEKAREIDICYEHSVSGQVYPVFSYDRHMRNDLFYDPLLPLRIAIDFGIGAKTAAIIFQVLGKEFRGLRDYEMENEIAPNHAKNLWHLCKELGFTGEQADVMCYGDPAGNAREMTTGSTVIKEYRAAGFVQFTTPRAKVLDGIRTVRTKLVRGEMFFSVDCEVAPDRLVGYRFPTDDSDRVVNDKPVHDDASHFCDAVRYGVVGCFPLEDVVPTYDSIERPKQEEKPVAMREMPGYRSLIPDDEEANVRPITSKHGRRY